MAIKVLVLGGGGYFGLINTTFLSYLDDPDLCSKLGSISGCSIGGIEACALMAGASAKEIQEAFIEHGPAIFKPMSKVNQLKIPWYSDEPLEETIKQVIGDQTIGDTKKRYPNTSLFVPTLNLSRGCMKVYDNVDGKDDNVPLLDVCLETSAACFYFPTRCNYSGDAIIDGGLREVVPVLTHTTGLKKHCGVRFEDMDVFVLGAGNDTARVYPMYMDVKDWGAMDWLMKFLLNDVTGSNESTSRFWGSQLGFHSFEWFNPVAIAGSMADVTQTKYILETCDMYRDLFMYKWEEFMTKE